MTKKSKKQTSTEVVADVNIEDLLSDRFGRYSKYIIQERALPDIRDGLKPVQRRIIYAMTKDGNISSHPYRKSAKTVGLVIGNYHPHGDTSVYDALVRLSQSWKINMPLIDMQGNNGSIDNDPAAAMRYTEARLSQISDLLTSDLPYETVEWEPNFDDTEMIPSVLPTKIPILLVNGSTGIAAGYATNIAPFNLGEILDALILKIKKPRTKVEDILSIIKGPDFPTGGVICGEEDIKSALCTGKGRIVVRAKSETKDNKIIITEIPYEVVKSDLVKDINSLKEEDIETIKEVRDESDKNGIKIVIEIKDGVAPKSVLNYLYKKTDLQKNYGLNMVVIVDGCPKLVGLVDILNSFIEFRREVVLKRSKYLLSKNNERKEILEGLHTATSIMDKLIKTIRESRNKEDVIKNIIAKFKFTRTQAEAIANMRLYRLSNTDVLSIEKELQTIINENKKLTKVISNKKELDKVIIREWEDIKKNYAVPRKTAVLESLLDVEISKSDLISDDNVMVTVSKDGYLKRSPMKNTQKTDGESNLTKNGDEIIFQKELSIKSDILLTTTRGHYLRLPVYELSECKIKDSGEHISKYCKTDAVKILNVIPLSEKETSKYLLTVTAKGEVKKTSMKEILPPSRMMKIPTLIKVKKKDEVIANLFSNNNNCILTVSEAGYGNLFDVKSIPLTGVGTGGVKGSQINDKDPSIICAKVLPNNKNETKLVEISAKGKEKEIKITLKKGKRGGRGLKITKAKKFYLS